MAQNAIWSREFQTSIPRYQITRVLTIWHVKPTQSTALEQERFDVRSLSPAFHNLWLLLVCLKSLIKDTNRKKNPLYIIVYWLESAFTYTPIRCHAHFIDQSGQQPEFDTINWRETTHFEDDYRKGCRNVSRCQQHFRITLTRTIISSNYDMTSPQTVFAEIHFKSSIFHCNAKMSFGFTEWWKTSIVSPVSSDHSLVRRWCARSMAHFYSQTLLTCLSLIPVCHSLSFFRSSVSLSIFP